MLNLFDAMQTVRAMPEIVFRLESIASILSRKVQLDPRPTGSSKQVGNLSWLFRSTSPPYSPFTFLVWSLLSRIKKVSGVFRFVSW